MVFNEKAWTALFAPVTLLTIGAKNSPYFSGDPPMTRLVQSITPGSTGWAQLISSKAKSGWNLALLAVTVGVFSWLAGWHAALLALVCFAGRRALDRRLGPLAARTRPAPELVHVADKLSGYSFPSIFALTYASTIGFLVVIFGRRDSGALQITVIILCCVLLIVGGVARIALGTHWPSDVILSYLMGLLWAYFLIRFAWHRLTWDQHLSIKRGHEFMLPHWPEPPISHIVAASFSGSLLNLHFFPEDFS